MKMELTSRVIHKLKQLAINPKLRVHSTTLTLKTFGSEYGGWTFAHSELLFSSTVISCGLGEDASFDIELANAYNLNIIIVDPTPRAVRHFEGIIQNLGKKSSTNYAKGGLQEMSSYDLTNIASDRVRLVPKALWTNNDRVRFYSPPQKEHVSHSIIDYQNDYSQKAAFLEVLATTLERLILDHGISLVPLIKLDIEGAEIEVIMDFLNQGIYPSQILVEYDELNKPSLRGKRRILMCHQELKSKGNVLINHSAPSNFLYVTRDLLDFSKDLNE